MIHVGKISCVTVNNRKRVTSDIEIDGVVRPLWFEVDANFGQYLCWERSDAYILGLLQYAIQHGHDIVCETPATDRLFDQLTTQFLPALYALNHYGRTYSGNGFAVKITADRAPEVPHPEGGNKVGSGISCGVDSLHVFAVHPEVNYACLWSGGVHGYNESKARADELVDSLSARGQAFAEMTGISYLRGDTNYDTECFSGLGWEGMTTNANLFCAYCLQKFWSKYYVASGYDIGNFRLDLGPNADPAHYEFMLFAFVALGHFVVCMDGADKTRVEKVKDLINYKPAQKFLNVCWMHNDNHANGTYGCPKCIRTLNNLDAFGAVDLFSEVFDVEYFHRNRHEFLADYYRGLLQHNSFALEMRPYYKNRKFPFLVLVRAWIIVFKKGIKKILRRGKTKGSGFSSKG